MCRLIPTRAAVPLLLCKPHLGTCYRCVREEEFESCIVGTHQVVDLLGQRKGQMLDMGAAVGEGTTQRVKYRIPTRGLLVR